MTLLLQVEAVMVFAVVRACYVTPLRFRMREAMARMLIVRRLSKQFSLLPSPFSWPIRARRALMAQGVAYSSRPPLTFSLYDARHRQLHVMHPAPSTRMRVSGPQDSARVLLRELDVRGG